MAGYSSTPLFKKLGLKPGFTVKLINPPTDYSTLIGKDIETVTIANKNRTELDFVHFFTNSLSEFEGKLPELKKQIAKNGTIWVSWYKKSANKPTELTETIVRDTALAIGLVDVKVCAVDDNWTGLKLVYRLKDR